MLQPRQPLGLQRMKLAIQSKVTGILGIPFSIENVDLVPVRAFSVKCPHNRYVIDRNSLPISVMAASSLNSFKTLLLIFVNRHIFIFCTYYIVIY